MLPGPRRGHLLRARRLRRETRGAGGPGDSRGPSQRAVGPCSDDDELSLTLCLTLINAIPPLKTGALLIVARADEVSGRA